MLAHAAAQGWTTVTISSADNKWRAVAARAAAKAGFDVVDGDLREIVGDELQAPSTPSTPDDENVFGSPAL
jgi:predicted alpha/beta hydrolase